MSHEKLTPYQIDSIFAMLAQGVINIEANLTTIERGSPVHRTMAKLCELRTEGSLEYTGIEVKDGSHYIGDDLAIFSACPDHVVNVYGCTEQDLSRLQSYAIDGTTGPLWSGIDPPPALGSFVHVTINGIGRSCVVGYYIEHGFLGVLVAPVKPPAWYRKQNGDKPCHVVGVEITAKAPKNVKKAS